MTSRRQSIVVREGWHRRSLPARRGGLALSAAVAGTIASIILAATGCTQLLAPQSPAESGAASNPSGSHAPAPRATSAPAAIAPKNALVPSPRRIIGRVLSIDAARGFAFIDLAADAPASGYVANAPLTTRKMDLTETGELRASSYVRGRTLGAKIVSGQPAPGDEVVTAASR